jgi:hypothetical protein
MIFQSNHLIYPKYLPLAFVSLILSAHALHALPQITVTEARELEITATDGVNVKLPTGTIGRQISADKQIFKISYGKDLRGRTNIIIYPDPEKPQALELKVLNQDVKMSSDAVLTVIAEGSTSTTQFQSGMIGTVTVGTEQLTGGASAKLAQGSLTTVAANTPVFAPEPAAPKTAPSASGDEKDQDNFKQAVEGEIAIYEGPKVRMVEGDVMIAPPGKDILEMVKTSTSMPRLANEQRIVPGSTIQTGPQGKAIISPFPGCIVAVQPNSKVTFEQVAYVNKDYGTDLKMSKAALVGESGTDFYRTNHNYERKVHLNLMEGGVLSTIEGIKPETLDYQVKTPLAVAAARGTVYGVFADPVKTLVIVANGEVELRTPNGTFKVTKDGKILITKDGGAPTEFPATPEEIAAFNALLASVQDFRSRYDILASGDLIAKALADDILRNSIRNFRQTFQPRLNNFYMTPIMSP